MSVEALIAAIAGSSVGGIVAGGLAVYALMRGQVFAWRERGDLFKAQLADEKMARANEAAEHKSEIDDLHARKIDEQERMGAVMRGLRVEVERYRRLLRDSATPASVADRLDDLGGVNGTGLLPDVPATADSAPSLDEPVPGLAAATKDPMDHLP